MGFRMPRTTERRMLLDAALDQFLAALPNTDVELVIHFGSHARGTLHSRSDIDLIIIRPTDKPFVSRADDLIGFLPPGVPADLLVYTQEEWEHLSHHRSFHRLARKQGVVIYDAQER